MNGGIMLLVLNYYTFLNTRWRKIVRQYTHYRKSVAAARGERRMRHIVRSCHTQQKQGSLLVAGGLVLVCSEREVLLAGCWWLVCSEIKVLLAGG
jgi:hypothetical protein